jgi:hypothetical protein
MELFELSETTSDDIKYMVAAVLGALIVAFLNYGKIIHGDWNLVLAHFNEQSTYVPIFMNFVFAPICAAYFVRWQKIDNIAGATYVGAGTVGLLQILTITSAVTKLS